MKKITYILDHLDAGGVGMVFITLAEQMADLGHEVEIVVLCRGGVLERLVPSNVKLVKFKASNVYKALPKLIDHLKTHSIDALISGKEYLNVFAIVAHKISGSKAKHIVTIHTNLEAEYKNHPDIRRYVIKFLSKITYPFADSIYAVSNGVATSVKKVLGVKKDIGVIYNPSGTEKYFSETPENPDVEIFDGNSKVVLGCGRICKQKNFSDLIEVFAQIEDKNAKLLILGEGQDKDALIEKVKSLGLEKRIFFKGIVVNPLAYMYYADLFVLPSLWEGFGNVLVEALSAGCPIVSNDCPSGPSEILDGGKYGDLVEVGNIWAMVEAIDSNLKQKRYNKEFLQARAKDFLPQSIVKAYIDILK